MRQGLKKEHLLKLTLAVYRVTAIFPAGEDLGSKIREAADGVLDASRHVEEILGLFDLAEKKNWVDSRNFSVLRQEYEKVADRVKTVPARHSPEAKPMAGGENSESGSRQDKILAALNGNGSVKIGDLVNLFPGVNRRTVLRDLDTLCQTGVMVRNGSGRGVFYVINGHRNATMSQ